MVLVPVLLRASADRRAELNDYTCEMQHWLRAGFVVKPVELVFESENYSEKYFSIVHYHPSDPRNTRNTLNRRLCCVNTFPSTCGLNQHSCVVSIINCGVRRVQTRNYQPPKILPLCRPRRIPLETWMALCVKICTQSFVSERKQQIIVLRNMPRPCPPRPRNDEIYS